MSGKTIRYLRNIFLASLPKELTPRMEAEIHTHWRALKREYKRDPKRIERMFPRKTYLNYRPGEDKYEPKGEGMLAV